MDNTAQPQDKWFTDGDLRLHYLDWGNSRVTPMVLLHHHTGNAHYWDFFAQNMRQDYHILAVDRRGCGDSSWMGSYSLKKYVADLTKLVETLGLNDIVLIGHSMGGITAVIYAAAHPERVARLVIVDIGPELSSTGKEQFQRRIAGLPAAFNSVEEAVRQMKLIQPYYAEDFIRNLMKYSLKCDESGRFIFKYDPCLYSAGLGSLEWMWGDLVKIACPTLVVHGTESELLLPEVARRMVEVLPSGTLVDIERAGHNLPGDNPEAFAAAVSRFLSSDSKRSG